jgi:hypothetical protein
VIASQVIRVDVSGGSPGTHIIQQAAVRYRYELSGQTYESDNLKFGSSQIGGRQRVSPANAAARYPIGATIPVSYDPANPANAVSDTSISFYTYSSFLIGTLLLVGGAFYLRAQRNMPDRSALTPANA